MRSGHPAWQMIGFSCLGLGLLLALPGVRAVRADDGPATPLVSELPAAPACGQTTAGTAQHLAEQLEREIAAERTRIRVRARARGEAEAAGDVVVLNNSGYNYGADD